MGESTERKILRFYTIHMILMDLHPKGFVRCKPSGKNGCLVKLTINIGQNKAPTNCKERTNNKESIKPSTKLSFFFFLFFTLSDRTMFVVYALWLCTCAKTPCLANMWHNENNVSFLPNIHTAASRESFVLFQRDHIHVSPFIKCNVSSRTEEQIRGGKLSQISKFIYFTDDCVEASILHSTQYITL